jgi:hypothetical protein
MKTAEQIFLTGTMRTGASLVGNLLSVHSKIQVFAEKVHFFRFIYGKYDPLTMGNAERALHHIRIRWHYRFGVSFEPDAVMANLSEKTLSYTTLYNEILRYLCMRADAEIWVENVTLHWRDISGFLNMFPNGKAIHVYRDPRGVLASWRKMTFSKESLFLNVIFNWIDSINHMRRYSQILPADRYMAVKFEDMHAEPEKNCHKICDFLGIEFEELMLQPEKWAENFNDDFVEANVSSHTREKVYGFNPDRGEAWKTVLEPWELATAEFLASKQMGDAGYKPSMETYIAEDIQYGFSKLISHPFLLKNFQIFQSTGEGNNLYPTEPTDPNNWASPDGFGKFPDSPLFMDFERELEEVEQLINAKYQH